MDVILFFLCGLFVRWLAGVLGFRKRRPKRFHNRRRRKRGYWKPDIDPYSYEEFLKRNAR